MLHFLYIASPAGYLCCACAYETALINPQTELNILGGRNCYEITILAGVLHSKEI